MRKTQNTELLTRFTTPLTSVEERIATGKALREKLPHERHADYRLASKRQTAVKKIDLSTRERLSP